MDPYIQLLLKLIDSFHTKRIDDNRISVIASYREQLDKIAEEHNLTLLEFFKNEKTVQGIFTINN